MSSCFPSKFCISRRQTLNEVLVLSSVHIKAASYFFPVLMCSVVTRVTGSSLNVYFHERNKIQLFFVITPLIPLRHGNLRQKKYLLGRDLKGNILAFLFEIYVAFDSQFMEVRCPDILPSILKLSTKLKNGNDDD